MKWYLFACACITLFFWIVDGSEVYRPVVFSIYIAASGICHEIEKGRNK